MNVILDTNIWVSFLFGKQLHTVADLFSNQDIHVYVSRELIAELACVGASEDSSAYLRPVNRSYVVIYARAVSSY